jgi:hypothetical protein
VVKVHPQMPDDISTFVEIRFAEGGKVRDTTVQHLLPAVAAPPKAAAKKSAASPPKTAKPAKKAVPTLECCICMDDELTRKDGVVCSGGASFLCSACFTRHVQTESEKPVAELTPRAAKVKCPAIGCKCKSAPYTEKVIAASVPDAVYTLYQQAGWLVKEQQLLQEVAVQRAKEEAADRKRRAKMSADERAADDARKHVVEQILTLKCPRCTAAFIDFDGCYALKCGRCDCQFCAYCLDDCGGDAHQHVAACKHKLGGDATFHGAGGTGAGSSFEKVQRVRRTLMVQAYFDRELPPAIARIAKRMCAKDLTDLGIVLAK